MKKLSWLMAGCATCALLFAGMPANLSAQQGEASVEIQRLIHDYYTAVQDENFEALSDLHIFRDQKDGERKQKAMQLLFEHTDTNVQELDVQKISVHPSQKLAAAFVYIKAQIFNDDRTDNVLAEQNLVFVLKQKSSRWGLLRVMPFEQYSEIVKVDYFIQEARKLMKETKSATAPSVNRQPVADFTFMPPDPHSDEDMVFTSTSTDPDGDSLQYTWYIEDDHVEDLDNRSHWTYGLSESGSTPIRLVVKDGRGGVAEVTHTIHVGEETVESVVETAIEAPSQAPIFDPIQMPEEPDEDDWRQVPVFGFTFMPEEPDEGDPIVLVNQCTNPSGEKVTYLWYVDGKHIPERDNQMNWELVGLTEGSHTIELEVREASGGGGTIGHMIEVY